MVLQNLINSVLLVVRSRIFVIASVSLFAVFFGLAYANSGLARSNEKFLSMSTLDRNMMAESYFQRPASIVRIGDQMEWNIQITNHLGKPELVSLRAKLLSPTDKAPVDNSSSPSTGRQIFEKEMLINDNSTVIVPFNWSVKSASVSGQKYTELNGIVVDNQSIEGLNEKGQLGMPFSIVFEVWPFDDSKNDYSFAWEGNGDQKITWNKIWFLVGE